MSILIKTVRIAGLRGLKNIEVELEKITVLTGMNNTGKTSFLKALQLALGNSQFVTQDDFFIQGNNTIKNIIVDLFIIPVNEKGEQIEDFSEEWERLLTTNRIQSDGINSFVPLRTVISFNQIKNSYKTERYILKEWVEFFKNNKKWFESDNGSAIRFGFDEMPFFYMDAQRDILEDKNLRSSYLGKMISKIEYSKEDIKEIEEQIESLNEKAVSSSDILTNIKTTLKALDSAMGTNSEGIEITPFTKKIRDLNKGLTIYYSDNEDSFSMEYHGMGTRSWSSLLTLKSFISLLTRNSEKEKTVFFPILAIEEPEAHLHPNAQKKLFSQINEIDGQKIISTHSPYIAATAHLSQIRNFYKDKIVKCGSLDISSLEPEDVRKITRQVINSRGEIFFSKLIVFFEGETEEQALPIFAEKYFDKTPVEMGIDFVGVGGYGGYLPFLRFAEALNIPWLIFSDGEKKAKKAVKSALKKIQKVEEINLTEFDNIFILDDLADFEKYLINTEYVEEIKSALKELYTDDYLENRIKQLNGTKDKTIKTEKVCDACKQNIYEDLLRDYNGDEGFLQALYDVVTSDKTKFAPAIAEQIVSSEKDLPPKVKDLFAKITEILELKEKI